MDTVQKALWYVETHSRQTPDLEQIANAIQVSPYHLTRAFAAVFGTPLMRYARRRRLSEAAKQLAVRTWAALKYGLPCNSSLRFRQSASVRT